MGRFALAGIITVLAGSAAYGQEPSRWYGGGAASAQRISADAVEGGGISTVGAVVGVRLTPGFSIEFEANHGLGEASRVYSGEFISFAGPGASREEIERLAVTMQCDTTWTPRFGWSLLAMWRTADATRVGFALFGGIAATRYDERRTLTVLNIPDAVDATVADLHRMMPDENLSRTRGGLTGGILIPIKLTRRVSAAPEIRYTYGSFGDEVYTTLRAGARVLWGF